MIDTNIKKMFACIGIFMLDLWGGTWIASTLTDHHWSLFPLFITAVFTALISIIGALKFAIDYNVDGD